MSSNKYTTEEKYNIVIEYLYGTHTGKEIADKYKVSIYTLSMWRAKYQKYGIDGLKKPSLCKKYSKELKDLAVKDYLSGKYSKYEIISKYEISSRSLLTNWITKYNSHIEIKSTGKGMGINMTNGRNTTWKERIEITQFCIANNLDYQKTSDQYNVSYQQIYSWVKKYEVGKEDALKDGRGRKKSKEELSPEDLIKLQMKKLEIENQRLKAENLLLKKLDNLERRRF